MSESGTTSDPVSSTETARLLMPVLTAEGMALLNELSESGEYSEQDSLRLSTKLREAGHSPELVSAVLTQLRLREAGAEKFGPFIEHMVLTPAGLEQASRMSVAARHAQRFAQAGVKHVIDLGCGLGADAMAMASMGLNVTAVEMDEATSAAATINLMPFPEASVEASEAAAWVAENPAEDGEARGYWLDPARREVTSSGSRRIFDPEAFSPPLSFVEELADSGAPVGVKLGPGIPHDSIPATAEAQWVSDHGSVVEVALWFNGLARENVRRSALVLGPEGGAELTTDTDFGDSPTVAVAGIEGASGYLYEPDGAVIRAGMVTDLIDSEFSGAGSDGRLLDEHIAYFCADELVETPFARGYRILEVLPYNIKGLRAWIRRHGVKRLDIKKRGVDVSPEELRRTLMSGMAKKKKPAKAQAGVEPIEHATLVLVRVGDDRFAISVEPVA